MESVDEKMKAHINRVIELSGGKEALNREVDERLTAINRKWNQDIVSSGRILRAHLFVEFYMTNFLLETTEGSLSKRQVERLTFAKKIDISENSQNTRIGVFIEGIRQLNRIRNQLAHNLSIQISHDALLPILNTLEFTCLRNALAKPSSPSTDPIDIIEDFSKHAATIFDGETDPNSLGKRFNQAMR